MAKKKIPSVNDGAADANGAPNWAVIRDAFALCEQQEAEGHYTFTMTAKEHLHGKGGDADLTFTVKRRAVDQNDPGV